MWILWICKHTAANGDFLTSIADLQLLHGTLGSHDKCNVQKKRNRLGVYAILNIQYMGLQMAAFSLVYMHEEDSTICNEGGRWQNCIGVSL